MFNLSVYTFGNLWCLIVKGGININSFSLPETVKTLPFVQAGLFSSNHDNGILSELKLLA